MAFITGQDVKFVDPLKDPLKQAGRRSQGNLESALTRLKSRGSASALASGRPVGEYAPAQLDQAAELGGRGLEDALYGILGNASLKEMQDAQQHQRKLALAREIGDIASPSVLQEVLGGFGMAARPVGEGAAIFNAFNKPRGNRWSMPDPGYFDPEAEYGGAF